MATYLGERKTLNLNELYSTQKSTLCRILQAAGVLDQYTLNTFWSSGTRIELSNAV